jgi:hypothetical protein
MKIVSSSNGQVKSMNALNVYRLLFKTHYQMLKQIGKCVELYRFLEKKNTIFLSNFPRNVGWSIGITPPRPS